jgi:hypothetical protein
MIDKLFFKKITNRRKLGKIDKILIITLTTEANASIARYNASATTYNSTNI